MLSDRCPVCPLCNVDMLWPNGWKDQNETWHAGRPRPRLPRVSCYMGTLQHLHGEGHSSPRPLPRFTDVGLCLLCKTAGWIRIPLGATIGLGSDENARWGPSSFIHSFIYLHSSKNIIHNKMYMQDNTAAYATLTVALYNWEIKPKILGLIKHCCTSRTH